MEYKAIIFDFFGVISSEVGIRWLTNVFGKDKGKELEDKYAPLADKEEISEEEYFRILSGLSGQDPSLIREKWESLAEINKDVVRLILRLKQNYKIILLSNATGPFLKQLLNENFLDKLFDDMVVSFEVKMVKPEKEMYKLALERSGLSPTETIFIDDRKENLIPAEELGIKCIQFKNAQTLEIELKNLGVKM